jgi:uncharacterized RDD family membrane protein YckC/ribosomal protein S27AE
MNDFNPFPSGPPVIPPKLGATGGSENKSCVECGKIFLAQDMIRHGDNYICVNCKPIFIQKLAEGAPIDPQRLRYAGFWIRVAAYIIDIIIQSIARILIGMLFGLGMFVAIGAAPAANLSVMMINALVGFLLGIAYETYCVGKWGATPGKMACKLKVVTPEGEKVGYGRAFGRYWAKMLSGFILCLGFVMVAFDPEKQGLHDRMCHTRVIHT